MKKTSFILPVEGLQIEAIRTRGFKALMVGCEKEVRIYNEGLLICKI